MLSYARWLTNTAPFKHQAYRIADHTPRAYGFLDDGDYHSDLYSFE